MTPEERLYRALGGEKVCPVPTLSMLADSNITNQAAGRKGPNGILRALEKPAVARFVDRHAGAISRLFDLGMFAFGNQTASINHRLGFDGAMLIYWRGRLVSHREIEDVFGRRFDIVDDGFGNAYMMYREGTLATPEQWKAFPRPGIASYAAAQGRLYRLWKAVWKERIAIVPFVGPGLWENSWQPTGFSRFVVMMRKQPAFVREVVAYFTALTVAAVDAYCRAGARVLALGDDLAYRSGPMLSPEVLEEFYGAGYRQITDTAHRHGARIMIHCCGNTADLLEHFVGWGFDGAHAFERPAGNRLADARAAVGDRLCLVGNIDITRTLVDASRAEVEEEVRGAIAESRGGGFILAPAHTQPTITVERVRWMMQAAREAEGGECGR